MSNFKDKDLMRIGIDLDNTITASLQSLAFFVLLTEVLKKKAIIYIISNREQSFESAEETKKELDQLGIYYDELFFTSYKKQVILKEKITIFFDDTDEYFLDLPQEVTVFKIREEGNFNFLEHKWIGSDKTVNLV